MCIRDRCKESAQCALDEFYPVMERAQQHLQGLTRDDVEELRLSSKPPADLLISAWIFMVLTQPPASLNHTWSTFQRMVGTPTLLIQYMVHYDMGSVPTESVALLKWLFRTVDVDAIVQSTESNKVARAICAWAQNVLCYHQLSSVMVTHREFLKAAQKELVFLVSEAGLSSRHEKWFIDT
eukprot:TRINITY_DN13983_c0_g1_i3.p1 TRINITY_DN13983_c0_g1~~TRINITY_DN13983_c0_g1_i3.p1  ORF type:complete len:181 (+),score=9.46 TRINITY_DN13983_c0_g1_i3:158-700(+)